MEVVRLSGTSHNGKLTVDVPEELDEKELELMVISSKEIKMKRYKGSTRKRNVKELMGIVGAAKHPYFPISKYDVYDQ